VPPSPNYELVPLRTKDGAKIVAQFGAALAAKDEPLATPEYRPTVLFFYGNRWHRR